MAALNQNAITRLVTVSGIDMNTVGETVLYTVPSGRICIPTHIVNRGASVSLTTASWSFGFNSGTSNDIIANAVHTELTGNTLYTVLSAKIGATRGAAADILRIRVNTAQGSAATMTVDIFGYLF